MKSLLNTAIVSAVLFLTAVPLIAQEQKVTIFFTGHIIGNYEPCGWKSNPAGGLARRAGYIESYKKNNNDAVLDLDLGNFFHQPGPFAGKINKYMRDTLGSNPVAVFNLASEDLNLVGKLDFGSLKETDTVSANLKAPAGAGYEHLKKYSIQEVKLPNGWPVKIGVIGIADPRMVKPNSGFVASDPLAAIAAVLPELKGKTDFNLVIGEMADQTADKIAAKFPEIYGVLRTERSMRMIRPRQVNNALIMSSVERGRMLGRMTLVLASDKKIASYTYKYIDLNQRVKDDPALAARASELLK